MLESHFYPVKQLRSNRSGDEYSPQDIWEVYIQSLHEEGWNNGPI